MKKNEFLEMCELLSNDSGLLSFDITSDNGQNFNIVGTVTKCTDTNVIIKVSSSNTNKGYSLSSIVSVNEYDRVIIPVVPEPSVPTKSPTDIVPPSPRVRDYKKDIKNFLKSDISITRFANQIDNIYNSAVKNHSLKEKRGRLVSELNDFYKQFGQEFIARIFVAQWFEKIDEYKEAISIYKSCNDEESAILCSIKSGDDTLYSRVPAKEIPGDNHEPEPPKDPKDQLYYGHIMNWNQEKICGMIKLNKTFDGRTSVFFHLSNVFDDDLREYLYKTTTAKRIEVSFKFGDNGKPNPVAVEINPIDPQFNQAPYNNREVKQGFIDYYNAFEDYGQVCCENKSFGFRKKSIIDPYLEYYFKNSFRIDSIDVYFVCESLNNKRVVSKMICTPKGRDEILSEFSNIPNTQKFDKEFDEKTPDEILIGSIKTGTRLPMPQYIEIPRWRNDKSSPTPPPQSDYAKITQHLQKAKTELDCEKVYRELINCIEDPDNPKRKTAIRDVISLCCRKTFQRYDRAIELFEKYRYLFNSDNDIRIRLYKNVVSAMIGAQKFNDAIELQEEIVKAQPHAQEYIKLASCYLKISEFNKALDACQKAESKGITTLPDKTTIISYRFLAYIGLKKLNDAEKQYNEYCKYQLLEDRKKSLLEILENARQGNLNSEKIKDTDFLEDDIFEVFHEYTPIERLYTVFLKKCLDNCQFEHVRDRYLDDTNQKYCWKPENIEKASGVYDSLQQTAGIYNSNGELRPGTFAEVREKRMSMAKVAEYCILHKDEFQIDDEQMNNWNAKLIDSAAISLWLKSKLYYDLSEKGNPDIGTYVFYLCETVIAFSKETTPRYMFFSALNELIAKECELTDEMYEKIDFSRDSDKGLKDEKNIKIAYTKLYRTLKKAEEINLDRLNYLLEILSFKNDAMFNLINSVYSSCDDVIPESDNFDLKTANESRREIYLYLDNISKSLPDGNLSDIKSNIQMIRSVLDSRINTGFLSNDQKRCQTFFEYFIGDEKIGSFESLINCKTNYDLFQTQYTSLKSRLQLLKNEYSDNPTEISEEKLLPLIECFIATIDSYNEEIKKSSQPYLTLENEFEDEGYTINSGRITLMLELANGKNGGNCTTASNISIDIDEDSEFIKHCNQYKTTTHYNVPMPLQKSDKHTVEFVLTLEPGVTDTVFAISFNVTFDTVSGASKTFTQVINVQVNDQEEFIEIPNPYDRQSLSPEGKRASLFKGRDADIDKLSSILLSGGEGKTILIYGQYRSGKTSLMKFLIDKIKRKDSSIIIADAGTCYEDDDVHGVIRKMIDAIYDELDDRGIISDVLKNYYSNSRNISPENCFEIFTRFTKTLKSFLSDRNYHVVIVMDEFGRLFAKKPTTTFMQLWKSIMEMEAFNAILIGHDVITQIINNDSNAFGVVTLHQINYIDKEASEHLIVDPTLMIQKNKSRFLPNAVDYIFEQSGGNVFYIQTICQAAVNYMNKKRINVVNKNYIQQAIEELLQNMDGNGVVQLGHSLFQSGETGNGVTDNESKIALDAIIQTENTGSTKEHIYEYIARKYNNSITVERIQKALNSLLNRRVIEYEDNNYKVRVRFYVDYLNKEIMQYM